MHINTYDILKCLNLSYQILCEPRQCENDHPFCSACIKLWSRQSNSACKDNCPVCRAPATGYRTYSREDWSRLTNEKVKCVEQKCSWTGVLRDYKRHMRNTHQTYFYANQGTVEHVRRFHILVLHLICH